MPHCELEVVETQKQQRSFLNFPYNLYRSQATWRPPLRAERRGQLSLAKNPGVPAQRTLLLAKHHNKVLGRIGAFINESHDRQHADNTGFFGYFDCVDDSQVANALLAEAESWLKEKGRTRVVGPTQWSVNEECGLLINGFEHPPAMMMPFGKPSYQTYIEEYGFKKGVDLLAFQAQLFAGYPRSKFLRSLLRYAEREDSLRWRDLDTANFRREVDLAMEIFNDGWSENWGYIPFSAEEVEHLTKEVKPILFKEGFCIGFIDDEPAAFIWMVPDLNELTTGLDGRLFPFGWAKLAWRLKVTGAKQGRIPLMGLRRKFQNTRKGLALVAQLCETVFAAGREKGFTHCELSWILEDNQGMIGICEQAAAKHYKTYRMYEKAIV